MVRATIKDATQLTRKANVSESDRTEARDAAADWIQQEIIDKDRWGEMTLQDLGEESPWSRQHIANTLEQYFDPVGESLNGAEEEPPKQIPVGDRDDGKSAEYRQGFRDGLEFARENPELVLDRR